jgi:hypothetical protein
MKRKVIHSSDVGEDLYKILSAYKKSYQSWFIGGGFARFIGHKVLGIEWGSKLSLFDYFKNSGDVDFFADRDISCFGITNEVHESNIEFLKNHAIVLNGTILPNSYAYTSCFADNFNTSYKLHRDRHSFANTILLNVKKQFVKSFYYNSIEQTKDNFDFYNALWFIEFNNNNVYLVYDEKAEKYDRLKEVCINKNSQNPLFAKRINKYVLHRGLSNGLSVDCEDKVKHFLASVASDSWEEIFVDLYIKQLGTSSYNYQILDKKRIIKYFNLESLNYLFKANVLNQNNLSMFIGKLKTRVPIIDENYSTLSSDSNSIYIPKFKTTDWATHKIELLSKGKQIV